MTVDAKSRLRRSFRFQATALHIDRDQPFKPVDHHRRATVCEGIAEQLVSGSVDEIAILVWNKRACTGQIRGARVSLDDEEALPVDR